ncbi:MAG: hypothetical protein AAF605_08705 [Myxococcota bacterium]
MSVLSLSTRFRDGCTQSPHFLAATLGLLVIACTSACSDEQLTVSFEASEPYRSRVSRWSLSLLEPPDTDWSCQDLRFADRSEEAVRTATRFETTIAIGEPFPAEITVAREGLRLLLVEGLSEDATSWVKGCAELTATIESALDVNIATKPVVTLTLPSEAAVFGDVSGTLPANLPATVTDNAGEAVPDVALRWDLVSLQPELIAGEAVADDEGRVNLELPEVAVPGPVRVQVKAAWGQAAATLTGFRAPATSTIDVSGGGVLSVGKTALAGEDRDLLVFSSSVDGTAPAATVQIIEQRSSDARPTLRDFTNVGLGEGQAARFGDIDVIAGNAIIPRSENNRFYLDRLARNPNGDVDLVAGPEVTLPTCADRCAMVSVIDVTPCDSNAELTIAATFRDTGNFANRITHSYALTTGDALSTPAFDLLANEVLSSSGCMDVDGVPGRFIALTSPSDFRNIVRLSGFERVVQNGLRVARFVTSNDETSLVGVIVSSDGISLVSAAIRQGPDVLVVEPDTRTEMVSVPISFVTARLNTAPPLELVSLLADPLVPSQVRVVIRTESARGTLTAISPGIPAESPKVFAADLDGDGLDEVILVDTQTNPPNGTTSVAYVFNFMA